VAVLAGGLDRVYPPEHVPLARIADGGGADRQRDGDGPSHEAATSRAATASSPAWRSPSWWSRRRTPGSLITARRAADQGRLVFAAPGSPLDPRAGGSNRLIKDGAHIVTEVGDILAELDPMLGRRGPEEAMEPAEEPIAPGSVDDDERQRVIDALGPTPVEVDEILRFTGVRPAVVHLVLLELALAGRLERHAGQRVSMI
jgi:DNA processing protein